MNFKAYHTTDRMLRKICQVGMAGLAMLGISIFGFPDTATLEERVNSPEPIGIVDEEEARETLYFSIPLSWELAPSWHKRDDKIVYTHVDGFSAYGDEDDVSSVDLLSEIRVRDLSSNAEKVLVDAEPGYFRFNAKFSADGNTVAFLNVDLNKLVGIREEIGDLLGVWPSYEDDGREIDLAEVIQGAITLSTVKADGTDLKSLTKAINFSWHPCENKIVFSAVNQSNFDIFSVNADGTGLENLVGTPDVHEIYPVWSPNGTKISYTALKMPEEILSAEAIFSYQLVNLIGTGRVDPNVYLINPDGSNRTNLTPHLEKADLEGIPREKVAITPSWLPSSDRLVFNYNFDITTVDLEGNIKKLTDTDKKIEYFPVASPDGKKVAYFVYDMHREFFPSPYICVIDTDGKHIRRLSGPDRYERVPAYSSRNIGPVALPTISWSPDSKQLVFSESPQIVLGNLSSLADIGTFPALYMIRLNVVELED